MNVVPEQLRGKKGIVAVEVGVYAGSGALQILEKFDVKKLYLVDPYEKDEEFVNSELLPDAAKFTHDLWMAKKKAAEVPVQKYIDQVEFVYEKSVDAAKTVPDELDLVYIDGNHDYKHVRQDILAWYPKIKKGGVLSGHDYSHYGVEAAVDQFCKRTDTPQLEGQLPDWWLIKT